MNIANSSRLALLSLVALCLAVAAPAHASILYVDDDAPPGGDGTSWATAHLYLQDALTAAAASGGAVTEIRVAQGTYKPDRGAGITLGDRAATFTMRSGLALRGGYAGFASPDPDAREVAAFVTVLSGDLAGDDGPNFAQNADNSARVVRASGVGPTGVLDGLTIRAGNGANGGGLNSVNSSPTLLDCTFSANYGGNFSGGMYAEGGHPLLTHCTFTGNRGYNSGGLFIQIGAVTLTNCTFTGNSAEAGVGGLSIYHADCLLTNCTLSGNSARYGGGMSVDNGEEGSSVVLTNCAFYGNGTLAGYGGGLYASGGNLLLTNCTFSGNVAPDGGGMYSYYAGLLRLRNCTFSGNSATSGAVGGLYVVDSSSAQPVLRNCVLWGNSGSGGTARTNQIITSASYSMAINHSCIQGWTSAVGGAGNHGLDPLFVDANGPDEVVGTPDDDLRLLPDSPCIDAGSNAAVPADVADLDGDGDVAEPLPVDQAGEARFVDHPCAPDSGISDPLHPGLGLVDMGAFERRAEALEGDADGDGVDDCSDNCVRVANEDQSDCDADGIGDACAVARAADIDCNGNGVPDRCDLLAGDLTDANADGLGDECAIRYVDDDAPAGGDGLRWASAHRYLQDAIAAAIGNNSAITDIRVAGGTYKPDKGGDWLLGDQRASFAMVSGVAIRGGYAGIGASDPNARDIHAFPTVLSGDLAEDDGPGFTNTAENSSNVLKAVNAGAAATLDGVTVRGGSATNNEYLGGGLYAENSMPVLIDCAFIANVGGLGGAIYVYSADAVLTDCTFRGNSAFYGGGGLYAEYSDLVLTSCLFSGNAAGDGNGGGAAYWLCNDFTMATCLFDGNTAGGSGGGLFGYFGDGHRVTNCTFTGNSAAGEGGGLFDMSSDFVLADSTFTTNSGILNGGGVLVGGATCLLTNCIVWHNVAFRGSQMARGAYAEYAETPTSTTVRYSVIQGGLEGVSTDGLADPVIWGPGNLDLDPLLTVDGHLGPGSPCIDHGDLGYTPPAGAGDRDGETRVMDGRVDIGSDEYMDTDGDGLPDWWEIAYFDAPHAAEPEADPDADGLSNLTECLEYDGHPTAAPLHVRPDVADATADVDGDGDGDLRDIVRLQACWTGPGVPQPLASCAGALIDGDIDVDLDDYALASGCVAGPGALPVVDCRQPREYEDIQTALDAAESGDTILVHAEQDTVYSGPGNTNLSFRNKSLILRRHGSGRAVLDAGGEGRVINDASLNNTHAVLDGFTIRGGNAQGGGGGLLLWRTGAIVRNCVLMDNEVQYEGGGMWVYSATPTMDGVTLGPNTAPEGKSTAGSLWHCNINLMGDLSVTVGILDVRSCLMQGPGFLDLSAGSLLRIRSWGAEQPPTVVRSSIRGTGDISVEPFATFRLEGGAVLDLSGTAPGGSCADPGGAANWGTVTCDGSFVVRDATVQNTNVDVKLAELDGDADIVNNDIRLLESAAGYGGEFFVSGDSRIRCNVIMSEGDRYLDLDPDPLVNPRPTVEDNHIYVKIKQGVDVEEGELLELRSYDLYWGLGGGVSGAFWVPPGAVEALDDPWVLESLEVLAGAKANLTNRQGFVFQDPTITTPEALYVKELKLRPNAVLNTGLQRLYYQFLVDENGDPLTRDPGDPAAPMENGSRIVDVPVLGFSLKIIAMDDQTEFDVRIRQRTRDPMDQQPQTPPFFEGGIGRIESDPDGNTSIPAGYGGVMDLRTRGLPPSGQPAPLTATSIAAKGAFARAGDEDIFVAFEYLFVDDPDRAAEIVVYLSDDPDASENLVEIARVRQPSAGRAGTVGSGQFAAFNGTFPRGTLNFTRGTYVELKLSGQPQDDPTGAPVRVWIDNFDPQVRCTGTCADLSGDHAVSTADFLYVLGEYGQTIEQAGCTPGAYGCSPKSCLDSGLSRDGVVDMNDLVAWDFYLDDPTALNLCGTGEPTGGTRGAGPGTPVTFPAGTLVVAGKPTGPGLHEDYLYPLTSAGACNGEAQRPASVAGPNGYRGNTRLIAGGDGELYQLHTRRGLVRLSDARVVVAPAMSVFEGKEVYVGVNSTGPGGAFAGVPLTDAAFDPDDATIVYVVPVYVDPPGVAFPPDSYAGSPYRAAAKLSLMGDGTFTVQRLYGLDPMDDVLCANSTTPPGLECSAQSLREIEFVPGTGGGADALLVTAGRADNGNDWLLIYNEATGAETRVPFSTLHTGLTSPIGLKYVAANDQVYVAASLNRLDASTVDVYRLNLARSGGMVTGVSMGAVVHVANMRNVVDIAENPAGGVRVLGFTIQVFDQYHTFANTDSILSTPALATVAAGALDGSTVMAETLSCHEMALPVSLAFGGTGAVTPGACCIDPPGPDNATCSDAANAAACTPFVCDVADHLPGTFAGCYGDADGNGFVNPGDRGFIAANIGQSDPILVCQFDMDGNGTINAGDRGFVSANINLCQPLPDWQNGSGLNHGMPDARFGAATFQGAGTTCAAIVCP